MNKSDFLKVLRSSLDGEIPSSKIEQSVRYYDDYIESNDQVSILEELGDPRLIAKSIIEVERVALSKGKNTWSGNSGHSGSSHREGNPSSRDSNNQGRKSIFNMIFSNKLILAILVLFALSLFIFVVGIIFKVFFVVSSVVISIIFKLGLPILVILLIYSLFSKR